MFYSCLVCCEAKVPIAQHRGPPAAAPPFGLQVGCRKATMRSGPSSSDSDFPISLSLSLSLSCSISLSLSLSLSHGSSHTFFPPQRLGTSDARTAKVMI